jgi:hypothetical protein
MSTTLRLEAEVFHERFGAGIGQHAANLRIDDGGVFELALFGGREECVVGNAGPQEEGQA